MLELQVSAMLLAAGLSSRMEVPEQFLPTGSKTVIAHCIDTILASGIQDTVVVINKQAGSTRDFQDLPVRFVVNPSPQTEMAESVRIGIRALGNSPSGILICLADHPLATVRTMRTLALEHYSFCSKILIPAYQGKRGHPALFPRNVLSEALAGLTLREVIRKDPKRVRLVDVPDEGVVLDIDTREDYQNMIRKADAPGFR